MAQHYLLTIEKEPKIFKSVARIATYFAKGYKFMQSLQKDFEKNLIYRREVMRLSDDYKLQEETKHVLKIENYTLQNSDWWKALDGGEDYDLKQTYSNLNIECHIGDKGEIIAIYMVL